jgi:hypothetical protein
MGVLFFWFGSDVFMMYFLDSSWILFIVNR